MEKMVHGMKQLIKLRLQSYQVTNEKGRMCETDDIQ